MKGCTGSKQVFYYKLPIIYYQLPITNYLLPIANESLLFDN